MRKTVIKFLVFIGLLIGVVGVTACDKKDDSNTTKDGIINNSNGKNNLNSNEYVLYTVIVYEKICLLKIYLSFVIYL